MIGIVTSRDDLAVLAPVAMADGPVDDQLVTGLHASAAEDAAAEVTDDEGVDIFDGIEVLFFRKQASVHLVLVGQFLETAVSICLAEKTVVPAR